MTREEFLQQIRKVRISTRNGRKAPHKPLLILLALGRLSQGKPRLASWSEEIRGSLWDLLEAFGPPAGKPRPEYPFGRLCNDRLWEVCSAKPVRTTRSLDVLDSSLVEQNASGGFPEAVQHLLENDPELVETTASHFLAGHFPESLHISIRDAVGLPVGMALGQRLLTASSPRRSRDPTFRPKVLAAYEYRCAICDFSIYVGDHLIGVDAAHIRWHQHKGPDEIANGLGLCKLHHDALDRGAIGLDPVGSQGFDLIVSDQVRDSGEASRQLRDAQGQPIRKPERGSPPPDLEYVAWHRTNVFRG